MEWRVTSCLYVKGIVIAYSVKWFLLTAFRIPYPYWVSEQSCTNSLFSTYFSFSPKEMTEIKILLPLGVSWKQESCFLKARYPFVSTFFLEATLSKGFCLMSGEMTELCFPTPQSSITILWHVSVRMIPGCLFYIQIEYRADIFLALLHSPFWKPLL